MFLKKLFPVNLNQLIKLINGSILYDSLPGLELSYAFASDLMSDALRWYKENMILITGLATIQTIRTAELAGISCIVIARGKKVTDDMMELAVESHISIVTSPMSVFEISGKLYQNGIKPLY